MKETSYRGRKTWQSVGHHGRNPLLEGKGLIDLRTQGLRNGKSRPRHHIEGPTCLSIHAGWLRSTLRDMFLTYKLLAKCAYDQFFARILGRGDQPDPNPALVRIALSFSQSTDLAYYLTSHLRLNAVYWGLTALCIMGHKDALDREEMIEFVMSCWDEEAGTRRQSFPLEMDSLSRTNALLGDGWGLAHSNRRLRCQPWTRRTSPGHLERHPNTNDARSTRPPRQSPRYCL